MSFHRGKPKPEFRLWTPIPWLLALAVVIIVGVVALAGGADPWPDTSEDPPAPEMDTGEKAQGGPLPKPAKQGQGPLTRIHQFYGPLNPAEGDPGWNCLTQGGKSC